MPHSGSRQLASRQLVVLIVFLIQQLLPGVHVAIANPDTLGQCADSHLGEIWVSSPHNSTRLLGPFNINSTVPIHATSTVRSDLSSNTSSSAAGGSGVAYENAPIDPLRARFVAGDTDRVYARTGFLGFVRRTELTQSDGGSFIPISYC